MKKEFTKKQQNALKTTFGWGASNLIEKHLIKKDIVNTNGTPFSNASIRTWLNGRYVNENVYKEILILYSEIKAEKIRLDKEAEKIFKK